MHNLPGINNPAYLHTPYIPLGLSEMRSSPSQKDRLGELEILDN